LSSSKLQAFILAIAASLIAAYIYQWSGVEVVNFTQETYQAKINVTILLSVITFLLFVAVTYIGVLSNKISKYRKGLTSDDILSRYNIAKHINRQIREKGPQTSSALIQYLTGKKMCSESIADEVISDMSHEKILKVEYRDIGFYLCWGSENRTKLFFKP